MFYLNTIEQLFHCVEQLDQLELCLPYSRLLTGIPMLVVFQNIRWNSNKTSLDKKESHSIRKKLVSCQDNFVSGKLKKIPFCTLVWFNVQFGIISKKSLKLISFTKKSHCQYISSNKDFVLSKKIITIKIKYIDSNLLKLKVH